MDAVLIGDILAHLDVEMVDGKPLADDVNILKRGKYDIRRKNR